MSKIPVIRINGQEIKPPKPKMALWRAIIKLKDLNGGIDETFLDSIAELIVIAFKNPLVTVESIENELDLDEYMALFRDICEWVERIATDRVEQIPNATSPKGEN